MLRFILCLNLAFNIVNADFPFYSINDFQKVYENGIINRNVSYISDSHCRWLTKNCGKSHFKQRHRPVMKIHGGNYAQEGQLPWVVYVATRITITKIDPVTKQPVVEPRDKIATCSGTLISGSHVLTVAHCLYNHQYYFDATGDSIRQYEVSAYTTESVYKARLITGAIKLSTGFVNEHTEKARIISPDFRMIGYSNDYAIIEIEPALKESEMKKRKSAEMPACLPNYDLDYDNSFVISGWGETDTENLPTYLQTAVIYREPCMAEITSPTAMAQQPMDVLCASYMPGGAPGDSGAGFTQQVKRQATVVAVYYGRYIRGLDNRTQAMATLLVPEKIVHKSLTYPLNWIRDNIELPISLKNGKCCVM